MSVERMVPDLAGRSTFTISLTFRKFTIDPAVISKTLELQPARSWRAGERVPMLDGTPGRYRDPESAWGFDASYDDDDEDGPSADERLNAFLEPLVRQRLFVRELAAASASAHIDVNVPGQFHFGCSIPPATLSMIADLGLDLGIEVFPNSATGFRAREGRA